MNFHKHGEGILLSEAFRQIDPLCDAFDQAWKERTKPQIEQYLQNVPETLQRPLLRELILIEIEYRRQTGDHPQEEDYAGRFPAYREAIGEAFHASGTGAATLEYPCNHRPPVCETVSIAPGKDITTNAGGESLRARPTSEGSSRPTRVGRYEIVDCLGQGGFGVVYLAYDRALDRRVAVKMPLASRFTSPDELENLVQEARTAAQLEHPGIVTIHDVQRDGDAVIIVQQYIDGGNLQSRLLPEPWPAERAAELTASIADALAFAHRTGFVHRDLKPSNVLLDADGQPHIADFGLAIHETAQRTHRGERAGTPHYMSPEQVRGDVHLMDGRTDIWSLGVIFYELLCGRRPFAELRLSDLFDEIEHREPKPPSQIRIDIPQDLERICLRCLSKQVTDRYESAARLAQDLRQWLARSRRDTSPIAEPSRAKIVPRGLRSFGPEDAEFFLELLPGPRDRNGLPESLRFWKTRIEGTEPETTFAVGLIYGPSGCGKSSLVRAGLLPRLGPQVASICIEASQDDTELRLVRSMQRRFPQIPAGISLRELFERLQAGEWLPAGNKVLIVLDQFEQWLHGHRAEVDTEVHRALRCCDGERVQCLCLVRDDFWLAASRFMHAIGVDLREGQNVALVDLFDSLHARKVLATFGSAYGRLPEIGTPPSSDQAAFLDQAVDGLAQDGMVMPVRLALFADFFKGRPWSTASLRAVGGLEGLGVAFLEETFTKASAPAAHRWHQHAARSILECLLPESTAEIRGHMRSCDELLRISGYSGRPDNFRQLIHILDNELHLIAPTDPEGAEPREGCTLEVDGAGKKWYQLSHDYVVPAVRRWLAVNESVFSRAKRWCTDPERVREAGIGTLVVTGFFTVWHVSVILMAFALDQIESSHPWIKYLRDVGPLRLTSLMLCYIAFLDLPYFYLSLRMLKGSSIAVHIAVVLDLLLLTFALLFITAPDSHWLHGRGSGDQVVGRWGVILFLVGMVTAHHLIALAACRARKTGPGRSACT